MDDLLEFELDRRERPVKINNEDYILVELDGRQRDKYMASIGRRSKTGADGKTELKNYDGMQADLIAESLYKIVGDERQPVAVAVIQSWPSRISSKLFDVASVLSGLVEEKKEKKEGEEEEAEAGND